MATVVTQKAPLKLALVDMWQGNLEGFGIPLVKLLKEVLQESDLELEIITKPSNADIILTVEVVGRVPIQALPAKVRILLLTEPPSVMQVDPLHLHKFTHIVCSYFRDVPQGIPTHWWPFGAWYEMDAVPKMLASRSKRLSRPKDKFCAYVQRNARGVERTHVAEKLMEVGKVDCAGQHMNNCPLVSGRYWGDGLIDFYSQYKFVVVGENCIQPGYISEKLLVGLASGCVPIYVGCDEATVLFNPAAFIHVKGPNFSIEEVVAAQDPEIYQKYLDSPIFVDNKVPDALCDEPVKEYLRHCAKFFSMQAIKPK